MMPSEYLKKQVRGTIQLDGVAIVYREAIGANRIMFSSDYPHATCDWPNSRQWMHHLTKGCTDDERERILAGNALEWYGLN
jgi:predicted TIM-barrel fold metal-dependent hydrolase